MTGQNGFENIEVGAETSVFESGIPEFRPNSRTQLSNTNLSANFGVFKTVLIHHQELEELYNL